MLVAACTPVTAPNDDRPDAGVQDTGALVISDLSLTVLEGGDSRFTIALSSEPAGVVTIALGSSDDAKASVSPTSLALDATNWSTPQEITVSGGQDSDATDDQVSVSVSSAAGDAQIPVAVLDDDAPTAPVQIQMSTNTVAVVEGMQTVFQVRLTAQPAATTTVNVASNNSASVAVSPATLTFTTADWNTYQNVAVTAVEDNNLAPESVTATVSSAGLNSKSVMVTTTDNDTQALVVSQSGTLGVSEGASETFTVRLAYQPLATTTVSAASASTTVATVSPASLTFTTTNWNTSQTVTVTGAQDSDYSHENTTITVSSVGAPSKSFAAVVPDNDLINAPNTATACRGYMRPIDVSLNGAPFGGSLTVTATATYGTVTPSSLTYTSTAGKTFQFTTSSQLSSASVRFSATGQATQTVDITIIDC